MSWDKIWWKRMRKIRDYRFHSRRAKLSKLKLAKFLSLAAFLGIIFSFFLGTVLFAWYARDLPRPDRMARREGFATKIYDRNQKLLYDVFREERRTPVELKDIPQHLKDATIAIEDKNFYKHQGFDPTGWLRAIYNIIFRRTLQGGSTLTQQLVKNVLLTPQRTIGRKIKEFVLAVQIERKYSKDEILQMYLNEAPYGGTAWGVESASEIYFGKKVKDLNLTESAVLAGLPQRPSSYSPFGQNPEAYLWRTEQVLRRMREDGYITRDKEEEAKKELEKLEFQPPGSDFKAPHFVMYVKRLLEEEYGEDVVEKGGLRVYTTLDLELQEKVQTVVYEEIKKVESIDITNGAALVMDPQNGEILAMVGSKDYNDPNYDGQVNVTLSLRQPGSAIKPATYVTALKKGYTPASLLIDVKTTFPGGRGQKDYIPVNYDGKFHGPAQIRFTLGNSLNIPAVKMLANVGIKGMLETAYKMGFTTLEPTAENVSRFGLSLTLGGGEVRLLDMVSAYSAFANEGYKVKPVAILKVEDYQGKVLKEEKPSKLERVLTPEEAFLISDILSDNNARLITFGVNSLLNIPGVAVKTGTTDDMRDNWAVGWTPGVIVISWVGNNDNSPMKGVASGISGASPIWRRIILEVLRNMPRREFSIPEGIVKLEVDAVSGFPSHDGFPSRTEYLIKGTVPSGPDPIHTKLKLCKGQNKLATETQIAKGDYEEKEFIILKEKDPSGAALWQVGINAWISEQGDERYHYPTEYCGVSDEVVVNFRKPHDKERIESNEFEIEIEAVSAEEIERVKIYVDDDFKKNLTSRPFKSKLSLDDGVYELKAEAIDKKDNKGEAKIKIGVKRDWDWQPEPPPSPSPSPSPSPTP